VHIATFSLEVLKHHTRIIYFLPDDSITKPLPAVNSNSEMFGTTLLLSKSYYLQFMSSALKALLICFKLTYHCTTV